MAVIKADISNIHKLLHRYGYAHCIFRLLRCKYNLHNRLVEAHDVEHHSFPFRYKKACKICTLFRTPDSIQKRIKKEVYFQGIGIY